METAIRTAGFENVHIEILEMAPVHTACVLGRTPAGAAERGEANA